MSDQQVRDVLTGTWGAVSCALREDWEGFDLLMRECVTSDEQAANWSMAAVGGTAALLKSLRMSESDLLDVTRTYFSRAVVLTVSDSQESVCDLLISEIQKHGSGLIVGQAVGQLCMAVEILSETHKIDREVLLKRLCLSVATIAEDGPTL